MWLLCRSASSTGFCSAASAAEDYTPPSCGGHTASKARNPRLAASSDSSSSSDVPSTSSSAASASDDNSSLHTLLSIPSLHSLNPPLHHDTLTRLSAATTHHCLSTVHPQRRSASPALAVCPSSLLLYSASETHITVHRLSDLHPIHTIAAPAAAGSVKSVSFSSNRLFTAHQDGKIRVWRRSDESSHSHRLLATLPTAADRLLRLPLPSNYVTVRRHKTRLWIQHADAVSAVAANNGLIYSVSWDKTLKIWRASDLRCMESVTAHEDAVNAVAVAGDGTVYTGSADRRIRVWARGEGKRRRHELVATLERHRSAVNALALSADGSTLYSGACDRSVLVWEREDSAGYMAVVGALRGHGQAILALACAGDVLFSGSADRTVRIWRRSGGGGQGYSCLGVMEGHVKGVRSLAAVRMPAAESDSELEDYRVCSGGLDGEVRVWRVRISNPKGSDWSCSLEKISV